MITTCPGPGELARIGCGTDAGSCSPEWTAHIEECPECRGFLERCAAGRLESLVTPQAAGRPAIGVPTQVNDFTIECELGRGAMGVVYLAFQPSLDRRVALKVVPERARRRLRERRDGSARRGPSRRCGIPTS